MLKKLEKILFILLLITIFTASTVLATDIDLNLPGISNDTQNSINSNSQNQSNTLVDGNTAIQDNSQNLNETTADSVDDPFTLNDNAPSEQLQASGISSSSEGGLTVGNIINILLITVGVILILLAIAIIIRLKG